MPLAIVRRHLRVLLLQSTAERQQDLRLLQRLKRNLAKCGPLPQQIRKRIDERVVTAADERLKAWVEHANWAEQSRGSLMNPDVIRTQQPLQRVEPLLPQKNRH